MSEFKPFEQWVNVDLKAGPRTVTVPNGFFMQDNMANKLGVRVFDGSQPHMLTGTIGYYAKLADGTTLEGSGAMPEGNEGYIILPSEAFAVIGMLSVALFNKDGNSQKVLAVFAGYVHETKTDAEVVPGEIVADLAQLAAQYQAMVAATTAANNIVLVQDTQPENVTGNKIWVQPTTDEYEVPTYEEFQAVASDVDALKSAVDAEEYDSSKSYQNGALVWKDGNLYKAKLDYSAEAWTSGHWIKTDVADYISKLFGIVIKRYTPGTTYSAGEYVIRQDGTNIFVYSAKVNITDSAWVSGHWNKLTSNVVETLLSLMQTADNGLQSQIDTLNAKTVTNIINTKSFDVPEKRYTNIVYTDLLSVYTNIDKRDSVAAGIDRDIRYQNMPYSIKLTTSSSASNSACRVTFSPAYQLLGTQEVEVCLYIDDATDITQIKFEMLEGAMTKTLTKAGYGIHDGWNKLRFVLDGAGNMNYTADNVRWQITVYTTAEINVWIASVVAVKPDKANVIIVDDGPYKTFYDNAYPALKAAGVPVTWALDPVFVEDTDNTVIINPTDLDVLSTDGLSEFSFHSYDGTIMSTASEGEALSDTLNCIRYLKKHGINPTKIWRASWLQNNCLNHAVADLEVDASASYNGTSGVIQYPYPDRYNIPRYAMQDRTTSAIDAIFEKMYNQHVTIFLYAHGVSTKSGDVTQELFSYWLNKITDGITNGWLNATTYNRLDAHYTEI